MSPYLKTLVLSLLLSLTACQKTITQKQEDQQASLLSHAEPLAEQSFETSKKHKIGVLLPFTGPHADLGKALRQATELSFFEHSTEYIELIYKDTEGTSHGALKAAQDCLNENVEAIVGPVFATEAKAIKPLLKARFIPVLSFSNDPSVAGQGVFILGFSPHSQVQEILTYAAQQHLTRIAALVPTTAYGHMISKELKNLSNAKKITLVGLVPYEGNGENLKVELHHLKHISYDALFLAVGGSELTHLLNNLTYYDFDYRHHQLLGTALWEGAEAIPQIYGGWYAVATPETYKSFENQFEKLYGIVPKRMASLGYDAIVILSTLLKENSRANLTLGMLTQTEGFFGANGFFRLKEDGSVERKLSIFRVSENGPQLLKTLF